MKIIRLNIGIVLVLNLLNITSLFAQNGSLSSQKLSIQQCISKAIANNLQIKQSKLQIESSENSWYLSKYSKYPTANGTFNQSFLSGRSIDPFTNQYTDNNVSYQNLGINLNATLYAGNQINRTIQMNELGISAAQQDQKAAEELLSLAIIGAFFQVLNAEDQLEIVQKQAENSRFQLNRANILQKEGMSSRSIILDLKAQIATDELAIGTAENNLENAKTVLLQTMNEKNTDNISLDRKGLLLEKIDRYKSPLDAIIGSAMNVWGNVNASKIRSEMADKNIEITAANALPTVSLFANLGTNYSSAAPTQQFIGDGKPAKQVESLTNNFLQINGQRQFVSAISQIPSGQFKDFGYFNQLNFNFNRAIGLSVKIPIFNGFSTKYRTDNAKIAKKVSDLLEKNTELQLQNEITLAYKNMNAALKKFQLVSKQLTAVEDAFALTKTRFEEGTINSLEFTLAKTNLDKIKLNQVQAKYEYIYRTSVLDFYMGKL